MSAQGEPEGPPTFVAPGVGDSGTGLHAGIGMLAALRARDATGQPQRVEVAMQDGIVNLMRIRMIDTFNTGLPVERQGNTAWGGPPMIYPCKPGGTDDYIAIVLAGDSWDTILALADRADLIGDPRYSTPEAREQRPDEVEEIITSWTCAITKYEAMQTLTELGIAAERRPGLMRSAARPAPQGAGDGPGHPRFRSWRLPGYRLPHQGRRQRRACNSPSPAGRTLRRSIDHHARNESPRGRETQRRRRGLGRLIFTVHSSSASWSEERSIVGAGLSPAPLCL